MAMQAATVEILIEKAKFEPRVAVAVAEAMDDAIGHHVLSMQPVTVPILDARLSALKLDARLADLKTELVRWMFLTVMGQFALISGMVYFLLQQFR